MKETNNYTYDFVINELKTRSIHDKYPYVHPKKTKGKVLNMSLGRIYFNECLPEDYRLIDEPVNQKLLTSIIKDMSITYEPMVTSKIVGKMQKDFFRIGTISPSTLTIDVFIPPHSWLEKKKEFEIKAKDYNPTEFQKEAVILTKELVKHIESKGYRIHNILAGGIKGSPVDDWKNLLVGKGYVMDLEGNLLGPITHGISEGFTKQEYFHCASEARRGFYYRSSLTAIPGYLARKLTMASANITLDSKDCNSKKYYEMFVNSDNIKSIIGRYISHEGKLVVSTPEILATYLDKVIKMRSPLYCQSKQNKICPICFGTLAEKLDTKTLGILAAGVINLITVNALMKMRHKSSQVDAKDVDFPGVLKTTKLDLKLMNKYLDIQKTKIIAKLPVTITIDRKDYHETELLETSEYFQIPGLLNLTAEELKENIELPFDFQVKIFKPTDYYTDKSDVILNYITGETIIQQDYIIKSTDPSIIRKLFDAGYKYLNTPERLTEIIYKQIPDIDMCYIELIVQNMFRSKKNTQNNCRLTHYKDCEIVSQKRLPFLNSWVNSLSFESIEKGIKKGLLTEQDIRHDVIEKIVIEEFIK
jgi:hypothetical protein